MEVISSKSNDKIKYAVKLRESASFRKKEEKFFLESARLLKMPILVVGRLRCFSLQKMLIKRKEKIMKLF
jgi:hypothetical protein